MGNFLSTLIAAPHDKTPVGEASTSSRAEQEQRSRTPPLAQAHIPLLEPELQAATNMPVETILTGDGGDRLAAVVREYGFAVVTGVLPPEDVAAAEGHWSADLRSIVGDAPEKLVGKQEKDLLAGVVDGDEACTFPADTTVPLGMKFVCDYGLTQGRMAWFIRRHPNVHRVYEALHAKDEADPTSLCVGTDSIFYSPSPLGADTNVSELVDDLWPHTDLSERVQPSGSWATYQSIVYVWPADERSKATVILPHGNAREVHDRLFKDTPLPNNHFRPLPSSSNAAFAEGARRIPVPAGGMVVWSCDTIHQGWAHGKRLAVPVCMEPKHRRDAGALERKRRAVKLGLTTTHWASLGIAHGRTCPERPVGPAKSLKHRAHYHAIRPRHDGASLDDESDVDIDPTIDQLL